ncbi:glutamic-type intramembrane protease PrsW [Aneurinibacillus terranovensis]|uniref:glutamic-type intramembrane protease PrsW n=1 Tax=Aneurinibacillus terranovensis TaxID=278991 RepID=UPI0003F9418B|nr:glutamic-type intramembrane protease PrsW [Aneurinibacillus terranovensis]
MLSTLGAALAPGIAILSYFYLKDKYEIEPLHLVMKCFLYGILIVLPVMVVQYGFQEEVHFDKFLESFVLSGLLEELFKWLMIYYTVYRRVEFDEPYDGIVYSAAGSLGFATIENFFYLLQHGLSAAFYRALLPVSSHGLFGVLMGYYMGKAKFSSASSNRFLYLALSLCIPVLLHGMYDYILNADHTVLLWLIVPFMIFLWFIALDRSQEALRMSISYTFGRKYD